MLSRMASVSRSPQPVRRITATPKKRVAVELLGEVYEVKPPKTALLLAISNHSGKKDSNAEDINRDFQTILKLMFTPKDLERVQERLNSGDDELDLDHIFEVVEAITEDATGDPTS